MGKVFKEGSAVDAETESYSTPSTLFRSTLASMFTGRTSKSAPLLGSRRSSGRGGGLHGPPTTSLLHGVALSCTQLDPGPVRANRAINLLSTTDDQFRDALLGEGEDIQIAELLTVEEVHASSTGPKDSSLQKAMAADNQDSPSVVADAPSTESTSTASRSASPTSAPLTHLQLAPASRALSQSTVKSTNESLSVATSPKEPDLIHIPTSQPANTSASPKSSLSTIATDQPPVSPTSHDPRQTPANPDTPSTATDNLAISQARVVTSQQKNYPEVAYLLGTVNVWSQAVSKGKCCRPIHALDRS